MAMINPEATRRWRMETAELTGTLRACGLTEERKWGKPCFTHGGGNIAIVQAFADFLALMFFKGALLPDPERVLESQGENTRSAMRVTFRSVDEVVAKDAAVRALVAAAIDAERRGLQVEAPDLVLVPELVERLDADEELAAGFASLTPGRQRAYNLQIGGAKQAATRHRRIDKYAAQIKAGKGLRD